MKRLYLHGTTKENAEKILLEGFQDIADKTWVISENFAYVRKLESDDEDDNIIKIENFNISLNNIRLTIENAQITAALSNSKYSEIVLFLLEIDDEDIDADTTEGALSSDYVIPSKDFKKYIKRFFTIDNSYDINNRYIYLMNVKMENLNTQILTEDEEKILLSYQHCQDLEDVFYYLLNEKEYNIDNLIECIQHEVIKKESV